MTLVQGVSFKLLKFHVVPHYGSSIQSSSMLIPRESIDKSRIFKQSVDYLSNWLTRKELEKFMGQAATMEIHLQK